MCPESCGTQTGCVYMSGQTYIAVTCFVLGMCHDVVWLLIWRWGGMCCASSVPSKLSVMET